MKRRFSFLWVAFATLVALPGCGPTIQTTQTQTPATALVKIECMNASVQEILELLRFGKGKDINVADEGAYMEITVAFTPELTPPRKLSQIVEEINALNGVLHVDVMENPRPIRQNF